MYMYNILMIFSLLTSSMFLFTTHPLSIGATLLIQTLLVCLISGFTSQTFWFSYTLFLIFVGGMLILFLYVAALASNEMFKFSNNLMYYMVSLIIILSLFIYFFSKNFNFMQSFNSLESKPIFDNSSILEENTFRLNKFYNYPDNFLTIFLAGYLFLTLVAAVNTTHIYLGPLRMIN